MQVSALRLDLGVSQLAVGDRVALNPTGRFDDGTEVAVEGFVTYQAFPLDVIAIQDDSPFALTTKEANLLTSYTAESSITVAARATEFSTLVVEPSYTAVLLSDTFAPAGATLLFVITEGRLRKRRNYLNIGEIEHFLGAAMVGSD